jgi:hypothetical protein
MLGGLLHVSTRISFVCQRDTRGESLVMETQYERTHDQATRNETNPWNFETVLRRFLDLHVPNEAQILVEPFLFDC